MAGRDLSAELFGPEGGTGRDFSSELFGTKPTAPAKDAGFSLGDIAKSFGMGAAGSTKALTDVAGAGNVVSSKLEGATESLQKSLTPERQAEMERQASRMKAAEESGSILQEIKAGALNVAEAPLQSAAQAIGSFVPYLPAMFAAPVAAAMRLTAGSQAAIRAVAQQAPKVIGTAQGAGAVKGSIYDGVLRAEVESGVDPEVAKQKADAAQSYFGGNFDQIALGGGLGLVAGSSGVEKFLTPAGRVGAAQNMGRRVGEAVIKETLPEAAQGGQERVAQNIALQREGYDVDTFAGAAGAATQEALTGALGAAPIAALAKPDPTVAAKKEQDKFEQEEAEFRKQFGETKPVEVKEPELPTEFPGGYTATRRELSRQDVPESYGIFPEGADKPLTTVKTQEEAQAKLQTLTEIRAEEQARLVAESDKIDKEILAERRKLEVLEATGQTDTDQYVQSKAALLQREEEAAQQVAELNDRIVSYSAPLTLAPVGTRTDVQSDYVVKRGDQEIGAFPTLQDAELKLREIEPEPFKQAEQQERVKTDDRVTQLKNTLTPMLAKFGLQDVGLNVVEKIENDAGGSYLDRLINISLTEDKPIQTMRHEAMHALKDLQFFTPQQWKALTERANKEWIKTYLADVPTELNGVQMSRLDAYKQLGLTQEEIVEEAISDAFGAYDKGATPPPGMIAALFKKLKNFFANFSQALRGAGFESADDVFQRVERGELKSRKPKAETKKVAKEEVEKPEQTMGERLSLLRKANPDEIDISTQNPQGVKRIYDPITEMLSIDEAAVREAMKANPKMAQKTIQAIKSYGFIPDGTPNNKVLELFRENIVNNLMFLYNKVPAEIRNRSKLWYDGANKIASEMADNYDMSLRQVAAIMAAMSPQKDWFQNVSMAERAIDILKKQGDQAWTPDMLKYAESYVKETQDRKEREKRGDAFEKIKKVANAGTVLNDMDEKSAAAFVRAYDEAFHSRNYRIVTPEGGFGDLVRNNDGKPSTMMWSTYGPIEKAVSIFRDGSRANVSEQLGFEHKIRSFYNNIANPNSEIDHVTIDTHAVAAALFEALAGTDTEVTQNFGGTGSSDVLGVGGTYGLIADAYREAAKKAGVRAREMQSITWEAVRALFSEEVKSTIKPNIRAEWKKYKTGQQSFDETRQNVLEIAGQPDKLDEPDWIDSGVGQFVSDGGTSYDKTFTPTGGVRLREEREIREKVTFNLSAVTNSIPGLRELYSSAMKGDDKAYELLQKVAESSLQYLLKGTGAKIKVEYSKGVYLSDREPSISVSAAFSEGDQQAVMGALAKFAENYNQQQIHVRTPTIRKVGYDFGDGSYATPVYEIALRKKLNNAQISDIINQTGLQGFSVSERQVGPKGSTTTENFLTAYWVAPNDIDKEFESFDRFEQAIRAAQALAGVEGAKPKQSVERLYVYGEGPGARIRYEDIQSDLLSREGTDTVTPRLISEYLRGEPVKVFKQKDLTNKQVEGQRLLAKVFDELPTKDLKNPLVRKAYNALNKELLDQYNVMPIKVKLVEGERDEDGSFIDIYKNSAEMRKDVSDNNRFKVYKTEPGTFGPEGFNFSDHPLLKDSGVKDADGKPMLFNDVLRAVHDYYAHNLADIQFGPKGEAAAWRNHMSVTADPLARWALTAETRAQNAWQNFREGVEDVPLKDRPYADQKAMLPPIAFAFTGEADVDRVVAEYAATLTPEQQLGSLPSTSQYVGEVRKQMPKLSLKNVGFPSVKEAKEAVKNAGVPKTDEFKQFIAGNQWNDADGNPMKFYHATAREFFEFTPAGQSQAIFLATTPEEAETFGSIAEDNLRKEIYEKLLNKDEKLDLFQKVVDAAVDKGSMTAKEGEQFMRQVNRKAPKYGDFGDIEQEMYDALLDLSPTRMSIMPLFARAETPFDFENKEQLDQVMEWFKNNTDYPQEFAENWLNSFKGRVAQGLWQAIEDKRFQQALKALGYDGFTVREGRNGPKNYAVYKPEQVKSITGNIGDFSRETKDMRYSLKKVRYSPDRFDKLWNESMYTQSDAENKTKGYLAFVHPMEFVRATTTNDYFDRLLQEREPLDMERLKSYDQVPFLSVSEKNGNWKITGHEGRHRMMALYDAGYREVPVYIHMRAEDARPIPVKALTSQYDDAVSSVLMIAEVEPLSYANKQKALEKFTRMESRVKYSLPTIPQNLQDRMGETTTKRERKTVIQSIVDAIRPSSAADFRAKYLNRYNQMSVYDKKLAEKMGGAALLADQSAESAALMSDLGAGVAASAMGFEDRNGGIPVLRNGITTIDKSVKGLIASLAPLAAQGDPAVYQRYQYWAMVKRGQRLNKEGKLTGIDSADVAFAKILEQAHPEFVSVQKDLVAFNDGLVKYMVDTGVLSKERGQMYTKYADYIPFYRQMDGDQTLGPNLFQSLSGVKPPKKLKGADAAEAPLADFLETMVRNTQSSIQAGIKNYAAQRAINVAVQLKEPGMGAERLNTKENGPNIINVLEKGNLVSYRTADPLLVNAMMSLNQSELPFIGFLSAPADWLRTLVTKEPGFMMANMMRDSLSAWVTSGQSMTPIAGTVINFGKALARKSPGFEAMLDAGIIGGYEFSENIEKSGFKLEKDLAEKAGQKAPLVLRPFKSVWDALGKGTTASDAATRALIYERVLADTGNEAEALYRSLEVMNFHRKGSSPLIRVLTAAIPFFNARLQGLDLFYRASTGNMNTNDAAAIQRQFFMRGMTMMALSGLYWMLVSDDEEYKKQEQETRDNNWIIPAIGAKIPIPFEVGVLFKVIPERIMAYSFGNDTGEDLKKSMMRNAMGTFGFNPIPQTIKPVLEAVVDYNMFTMRPILGQGMKDVEPEFQVGPSTSNFAKMLAQNLGLSPIKVDHIIKGYTGTIGMYAIDTVDIVLDQFGDSPKPTKRFEQLPVIKRFASDPEARGFVTQYYELKDSVDTTVRTMNLLEKTNQPEEYTEYLIKNQGTLAFKDYVRDTEKTMTYLREMRVAIRASTMTGDEKRDSLLEISRMESAITSNIQEIKKAIAQAQ
jgi:polyhydroxyalkanoate synthesis regulator phasin